MSLLRSIHIRRLATAWFVRLSGLMTAGSPTFALHGGAASPVLAAEFAGITAPSRPGPYHSAQEFRLALSEAAASDSPITAARATPNADDDERLVRRAQQGSLDAFNQLVTRHERIVFNVCLRLLRDTGAAEDAAQDTFMKAWTSISTFQGGIVRPWLLRIATNRCYDVLRAQRRRPADSLDAAAVEVEPAWSTQVGVGEDPEGFAARSELSAYLENALGLLPEDQHVVVVLSDIHGYGYDEIAGILDIPVGTVKSRLSRGRAKLRQFLSEDPATREHFAALWRSIDT